MSALSVGQPPPAARLASLDKAERQKVYDEIAVLASSSNVSDRSCVPVDTTFIKSSHSFFSLRKDYL